MSNSIIDPNVSATWANVHKQVKEHKTWFTILGIALIILGCISIVYPVVSSVAVKVVIGWLILFSGILQIIYAFQTKTWSGFFIDLTVGIIYLIAGAWMSFVPPAGLVTLTLIIGILFLTEGVLRAYMSMQMRPIKGWGWVMFSAVMAAIAGILIIAGLPSSSLWVLGLLVGINFISSGWRLIFLASSVDSIVDEIDSATNPT